MTVTHADWTIILVEDTYDDIQVISRLLAYYGINVYVAGNGEECCTLLETVRPTAIVTDLAMPGMDGWETLKAIRSHPQYNHVPVIAITAYGSAEVAEEARRMRFDGYFSKPLDPVSFVEQLEVIVS